MQQLHILATARVCPGPVALANTLDGTPDTARPGFTTAKHRHQGQLLYYFQAVDRFKHAQARDVHLAALRFVNQSKSARLAGMVGVHLGMRGRLTKKVYPPLLVQEATFEVVGIVPHPKERSLRAPRLDVVHARREP